MKCCHISDTHDVHKDLNSLIPECEILFFTGDLTYKGSEWEILKLLEQFERLKLRIPHIVGILGNHEVNCEGKEVEMKSRFKAVGVDLLHNESIEIEGIKIWGSPFTPYFFGWAYQYENAQYATQYAGEYLPNGHDIWSQIPDNTQVLLSHCPPYMINDLCPNGHVGCSILRMYVESIPSIKFNLFGHIHSSHGTSLVNGVTYINSSIMNNSYNFVNKPHLFEIEKPIIPSKTAEV
jgi:Icc-related predicted phosphoesterase